MGMESGQFSDSTFSEALNEVKKLANFISKELHLIKSPSLLIQSNRDLLTKIENLIYTYESISSEYKEKFIIEKAGHNIFIENPDQKRIFEKIVHFFNQF